jgi:hypothetical protein
MYGTMVIHGKISGQVFVPSEPMPDFEGPAELTVYLPHEARSTSSGPRSVFDYIGKAPEPRSAEELDAQLLEERDAWNEP